MKAENVNVKNEAIGGLTTFFTLSYIIFVNPAILSTNGTGMAFSGVLTATVLLCFFMTLLMGVYAKLPYAVAPGMGINAFFTFQVILGQQVPWQTALGMVFWSGVLFVLISATPIRMLIATAIPNNLRHAVSVGIGLFLAFIGLQNSAFVIPHPVTYVTFGKFTLTQGLCLSGLLLSAWLMKRKSPFAFLAGIFWITLLASLFGKVTLPEQLLSMPDFKSVFFQVDFWGALKLSLLPTIFSLMFTDLFDSISTFIGVSQSSGLVDNHGQPLRLKEGLQVDAVATLAAGLLGSSSGTAYIESSAGIEAGGRTGLASIFTAVCFLPFLFLAPLAELIPTYATTPVFLLIGALMFKSVTQLQFQKLEDALPAYLTILLIPLTFSLTQGILWGFVSHVGLYVISGRRSEISKTLWLISFSCLILLYIESTY